MKIYPIIDKYMHLSCVFFKFDDKEFSLLKKRCYDFYENLKQQEPQKIKDSEFNSHLVGHLEEEFKLVPPMSIDIEKSLQPVVNVFHERYLLSAFKSAENICIGDTWINFQKKYEHNPPHSHNGLISFVIWVNVPYLMEDEYNVDNCKKSNVQCNGSFTFLHPQNIDIHCNQLNWLNIGKTRLDVDKTWEGRGVMFPAKLNHMVFPFYTSDEHRVSISGNYFVK
jgi:Putative 2OG-Fe(II) oxygenase